MPDNFRNTREYVLKSIRPVQYHNEFTHQIWAELDWQFVCIYVEINWWLVCNVLKLLKKSEDRKRLEFNRVKPKVNQAWRVSECIHSKGAIWHVKYICQNPFWRGGLFGLQYSWWNSVLNYHFSTLLQTTKYLLEQSILQKGVQLESFFRLMIQALILDTDLKCLDFIPWKT